jgi:maleylacetate reductase
MRDGPIARTREGWLSMREFVHERAPCRVVFGAGSLDHVPREVSALDLRGVLVIAGGSATAAGDRVAAALGDRTARRFTRVAQHVPERLADEAVEAARTVSADGLCCVGGGSATGLAKAVAVRLGLPIVAVPTTYAGSEATDVYGVTGQARAAGSGEARARAAGSGEAQRKRTATDPRARVRTVVYDPTLTVDLPARATAASGFNALAHAVAALTGPVYEPVARRDATDAIELVLRALPVAVRRPADLDARGELLWAAWLAGGGLSATGAGLHHRLCHVLGGGYGLVHAEVHAVLLPHTVARDPTLTLEPVAAVLGDDPAARLRELAKAVGAPRGLAEIGMPADKLDAAAQEAASALSRYGDAAWFRSLLDTAMEES